MDTPQEILKMPNTPRVCRYCGQILKDGRHSPEEAQELVDAAEPAPEPVDDTPYLDRFCAAFRDLALSVPPSVRKSALKKCERTGLDPMENDPLVEAVLEKAHASYVRKKERARASSAKRRSQLAQPNDD